MAELVLKYLQVFLTWPPVVAIISFYFMRSQREPISRLIDRIKQVNLPGGGGIETGYESELPEKKVEQVVAETADEGNKTQNSELSQKVNILDFNNFILAELRSNRIILHNLVKGLWKNSAVRLFQTEPPTDSDKLAAMRTSIDKKAIEDFDYIEKVCGKPQLSREEVTQAYIKSKLLINYLTRK